AGMGDLGRHKRHRAPGDIEQRGVLLAAVFINIIINGDPRVRVRLNVVASLKVTPSVEFAEVCTTSFRKMSSCTLSGVGVLLRVTVALPVRVATFPIGSSSAGCASAGAAAGAGACAGRACAILVRPDVAPPPACIRAVSASALAVPPSNRSASQMIWQNVTCASRCFITMPTLDTPEDPNAVRRLGTPPAECRMNADGVIDVQSQTRNATPRIRERGIQNKGVFLS
ncbi:MAG TPA: hypothetical protein VGM17_10890, partial [Rhizomicrobium sp.]